MSFKNRWSEPKSQDGRKLYRQLRRELRSSRTTKARRESIVALLDVLAKNPAPTYGLTDEVRELYTKLTATDVEDAMRHFSSLSAQDQQALQESVSRNLGEFQLWFAAQYWLMKHGEPNALDGGKHGEATLA